MNIYQACFFIKTPEIKILNEEEGESEKFLLYFQSLSKELKIVFPVLLPSPSQAPWADVFLHLSVTDCPTHPTSNPGGGA